MLPLAFATADAPEPSDDDAPEPSDDEAREPEPSASTPEVYRPASPPQPSPQPAAEPLSAEIPTRSRLQRVLLAVLLIAAAGLIGYVLSRPAPVPPPPDALARSVAAAAALRPALDTDLPAEARQFVRDEFGWRVGVPRFATVTLRGVAIARAAPAVEVPVFLYTDGDGRDVAVFAYNYALLGQVPDRLPLARADYDDLDLGTPVLRQTNGHDVLLWRDRDDIYVAVSDLPPETLQDGLVMEQ